MHKLQESVMKTKYVRLLTCFVAALSLASCGTTITYKTPNIDQPILLGSKIGIDSVALPSNAEAIGSIDGHIGKKFMLIGMTEEKEENADNDFPQLQNKSESAMRYVTNLFFFLRHRYVFLILGTGDHIQFAGNVYSIPKQ
jgi:hypothetical protein